MEETHERMDVPKSPALPSVLHGKTRFIEDTIIVELKSVAQLKPIHEAQLLTYMRLAEIEQGFLINFNVETLKNGLKSFIL